MAIRLYLAVHHPGAAVPERKRVEDFIRMVVSGDHVRAIEDFYWEDASMRENTKEPRRGRDVLVAHEAAALKRMARICAAPRPAPCSSMATASRSIGPSTSPMAKA